MTKPPFGMPGLGGSLGKCAICGNEFLLEIILGSKVPSFTIDGISNTMFAHKDCMPALKKKDWRDLPKGPLRTIFEQQDAKGLVAP